jgi:hypothetical protein
MTTASARATAWAKANPERRKATVDAWRKRPEVKIRIDKARRRPERRARKAVYDAQYRLRQIVRRKKIWEAACRRAVRKGIEFTIRFEELVWPTRCPALGCRLDYSVKGGRYLPRSPSLDRFDNKKGYVAGNVRVISMRANMIKSDATAAEIAAVARYAAR